MAYAEKTLLRVFSEALAVNSSMYLLLIFLRNYNKGASTALHRIPTNKYEQLPAHCGQRRVNYYAC
jgi:hypothetical protein